MKLLLIPFIVFLFSSFVAAQELPNLPLDAGAGTSQVWNNQIFYFGGSSTWTGSVRFPRVYKFDGSSWSHYDSIPDYDLWNVHSALVGDYVYLVGGWPNGAGTTRRYHIPTKQWTYLSSSPNTQTWGITTEYLNGRIYLINSNGFVWEYTIANDTWTEKTAAQASGTWNMSSILYNNEIYILGFSDQRFFKYNPASDNWTQLGDSPEQIGATAMGVINNYIYCAGGNSNNGSGASYETVLRYDITTNTWATDNIVLSHKRHWMAKAVYKGGLYVIGGFDQNGSAVNIVEEIVPQGTATSIKDGADFSIPVEFALHQNFPNPFNPSTTIKFGLPADCKVVLEVYNIIGGKVATLINNEMPAGYHQVDFNGVNLSTGIYMYRLTTDNFIQTMKMILMK